MNHDKTFKMLQEKFKMLENPQDYEEVETPDFGSERDILNLLQGVADKHLGANLENATPETIIQALREAYNLGMGDVRLHRR